MKNMLPTFKVFGSFGASELAAKRKLKEILGGKGY